MKKTTMDVLQEDIPSSYASSQSSSLNHASSRRQKLTGKRRGSTSLLSTTLIVSTLIINPIITPIILITPITPVTASLNLDPHFVEQNVGDLREKVFVDVRFVQQSPYNTLDYQTVIDRNSRYYGYNGNGGGVGAGAGAGSRGGGGRRVGQMPMNSGDFPLSIHPHKVCSSVDGPKCFDDSMLGTVPKSVMQFVEGDRGDEENRWLEYGILPGSGVDHKGEASLSEVDHWSLDSALVRVGATVPEGLYKRKLSDRLADEGKDELDLMDEEDEGEGNNGKDGKNRDKVRETGLVPHIPGKSAAKGRGIVDMSENILDHRVKKTSSISVADYGVDGSDRKIGDGNGGSSDGSSHSLDRNGISRINYTWSGRWVVTEEAINAKNGGTNGKNGKGANTNTSPTTMTSTKGAQLSDATGYIRFSKPILLRSLVIQCGKGISLVGGRLRGETVWMRVVRAKTLEEEVYGKALIDLIADHSDAGIGLKAVDELFFLTAENLRLISLEMYEAAGKNVGRVCFFGGISWEMYEAVGKNVQVLLLGPHARGIVYENIDEAGTKHLMSLNELVKNGLTISKIRTPTEADVKNSAIVTRIGKMLMNPSASATDVSAMLESGLVPESLKRKIIHHDLIADLEQVLTNPRALEGGDMKLKDELNQYNDLIMSAWLHWIQMDVAAAERNNEKMNEKRDGVNGHKGDGINGVNGQKAGGSTSGTVSTTSSPGGKDSTESGPGLESAEEESSSYRWSSGKTGKTKETTSSKKEKSSKKESSKKKKPKANADTMASVHGRNRARPPKPGEPLSDVKRGAKIVEPVAGKKSKKTGAKERKEKTGRGGGGVGKEEL